MRLIRWLGIVVGGALAGLVGAAAMLLVMAAERTWLGISPPPEALPDRIAPTLDIATFFSLFGKYGGYNGLKKFGVATGIEALVAAGLVVGVVYALFIEQRRARAGAWRNGFSLAGLRFVGVVAALVWIGTLIALWPVLGANFRGLPPSSARVVSALGLLAAYAAYAAGLVLTCRFIIFRPAPAERPAQPAPAREPVAPPAPVAAEGHLVGRRAVVAAAAGAALAAPTVALVQRLYDRAVFPYDGLTYSGPGVQPITPNDKFYTVTKNVVDPDVAKSVWGLEIGGLVAEPKRYGFADLTALPAVVQETTLMCISNRIGSGLFSNAVWKGVPLRDLLTASRPGDGAVEVLLHAADGYTDTFAFDKAMEPTTLVVYQMNGQPLPQRHGYPVRVIVPGLYGEKNVKWVTAIDVIDHDGKGFYEQQGWGPNFVVPTRSDFFSPKIDAPRSGFQFREPFRVGQTAQIRGRAFAGDRGVRAVEVSTDDGETWRPARIDYPGTHLTWAFWTFSWRPTAPGTFHLVSQATDGAGAVQPPDRRGIVPQGAAGYQRVLARVDA
ncbi:MAG TPA: molybdopterin-dependent oxidoreductase [Thermomicrobiales bacterium]|nr:molybdopterin-dependent oxidoreductase [Thermomicrobiales bacterium]